jgi:hypothetical protein
MIDATKMRGAIRPPDSTNRAIKSCISSIKSQPETAAVTHIIVVGDFRERIFESSCEAHTTREIGDAAGLIKLVKGRPTGRVSGC